MSPLPDTGGEQVRTKLPTMDWSMWPECGVDTEHVPDIAELVNIEEEPLNSPTYDAFEYTFGNVPLSEEHLIDLEKIQK